MMMKSLPVDRLKVLLSTLPDAFVNLVLLLGDVNYAVFYISKFAHDRIRTADLWCQMRPLYQLSHNHCPNYAVVNFVPHLGDVNDAVVNVVM